MNRIASPQDLQAELHSIMAYIHASEKPDRQVIASKLNELADLVSPGDLKASMPPGFDSFDAMPPGFDSFPEEVEPGIGDEVTRKLKEEPEVLPAKQLLSPNLVRVLEEPAVFRYRRNKAWMLKVPSRGQASQVGGKAFGGLNKRIPSHLEFLHDQTLYVAFPGGFIRVDPPRAS